mmetsp:Transcript_11341/g.39392  ORF Transcript_11341/g.39392 Transcript_11341/m.39392 type:complete len:297 (+) Transcript_11341:1-891(+)
MGLPPNMGLPPQLDAGTAANPDSDAEGSEEDDEAAEPHPPGDTPPRDEEGSKSPAPSFYDAPLPFEVAYGAAEALRATEAQTPEAVVLGAAAEAPPQSAWRKIENGGVAYWYNEATGVSQWEEPESSAPAAEQTAEPKKNLLYDEAEGPKNDDFEALCQAAEGDSICEPIGDGVLLRVIVKPAQEEDAVLDVTPHCVMVSLRAPIEDRWCNQALLAFCRRALHVPQRERNAVKITDGDESLDKIVHIPAIPVKEVIKRLHKKKDFEVDTSDVEKWIRHTERKQKDEERRMKRRKWA